MFWSKYFLPTLKDVPVGTEAISHQLSLRAGLVNMLTSGVYSYLPLGLRVLNRIEQIIREEMNASGAQELFLPVLQPIELWRTTGRDQTLAEIMITFEDKKGRTLCLGPTHEEVITDLVKNYVQSYRQLPVTLYQIQTKFRDELRTRYGIVRACEFIMKDAYSFDRDEQGLKKNYQLMYDAYVRIFKRCGLDIVIAEADSGVMGGDMSHEFLVPAAIGEDAVVKCLICGFGGAIKVGQEPDQACPQCSAGKLVKQVAIELGHVFQLGLKYSNAQQALFLDEDGKQKPIVMGCYGIGVSRLIAAIIETNNDVHGIIWPKEVAPFDVEILPLQVSDPETMDLAGQYCRDLEQAGFAVLVDDRDESAGRKFNDADLIGIPQRITIGKRTLKEGKVEIKNRRTGETLTVVKENAVAHVKNSLRN
ncbi:MAG: proline--tRNA ligase [Candidatus Omnitrophica bacterium]|nr:proline--tRNA ligase [Candidatus Omnitrophota bacterium]